MNSPIKRISIVNPSQPLHKNWSFWIAIFVPVSVAAGLSWGATQDMQEICFSSHCQNHFLDKNKLPIGILSLSVLFGVMVGRFHGSAQRISSFQQAEQNNTFRNFYDHRKLFSEWMLTSHEKQLDKLQYVAIESIAGLYHALFKRNTPLYVEVEIPKVRVEEIYNAIIEEFHKMAQWDWASMSKSRSSNSS